MSAPGVCAGCLPFSPHRLEPCRWFGHAGRSALRAKQHLFGLCGIHHHADQHLAGLAKLCGRGAGHTAKSRKRIGHTRASVAHMNLVASAAQTAGHTLAHGTQTDHAYLFHRLHMLLLKTPRVADMSLY
jgi:hypothetical protein